MMRAAMWVGAGFALASLASGCGPSCDDTCFRMFDASECNVQPGGLPAPQLIDRCRAECGDALKAVGGLNGYDPRSRQVAAFELSTETQAAAWMDCVWSYDDSECREELDGGCYPNSF